MQFSPEKFDLNSFKSRDAVLQELLDNWKFDTRKKVVPLGEALGYVTAEDVYAKYNLPVCKASAGDAYAVHSEAFKSGIPDVSGWVLGKDYIPADTGDDFSDDFDATIAVENWSFDDDGTPHLKDGITVAPGDGVRPAGSNCKAGQLIVKAHTKITPLVHAVLSTAGIKMISVIDKLCIGFIPTGSELIQSGAIPSRGENIEADGVMLKSLAEEWGAECVNFAIVKDMKNQLSEMLNIAIETCDLVLISGGSSKGTEDYNARLIQERSDYYNYGVRCVPGKPVSMGIADGKPVFNLPGPVLGCWMSADYFVRTLVYHYYGIPVPKRPVVKAELTFEMNKPEGIERQFQIHLEKGVNGYKACEIQRSAGISRMIMMNGIVNIPIGSKGYKAGDIIDVELVAGEELII